MAHIIITTAEEKFFKKLSPQLPDETTIVVVSKGEDSMPLRRWRLNPEAKDRWFLDADFVDQRRPFKAKEEKEFKDKITKTKLVDFFLTNQGDDIPQREWSAFSNKEWELMKFLRHSGYFYYLKEDGKPDYSKGRIGAYQFWVGRDAKIRSIMSEWNFVLKRVRKHFPFLKEYTMGIMENTCGEFGIYNAIVDLEKNKAKLTFTRYHHTTDESDWLDLEDFIQLIQKRCPYGDVERDDHDDDDYDW